MQALYGLNDILLNGKNYIFGTGVHALAVTSSFMDMGFPFEGFVSAHEEDDGSSFLDKPVISLKTAAENGANILITEHSWHRIYELVYMMIPADRIFVHTDNQLLTDIPCIACDHPFTFSGNAFFSDFLKERMFKGNVKDTAIQFCPRCGMYFSAYRPDDDEMDLLYSGYRNEFYQKQRQHYESWYTPEFNKELYAPKDGGVARKKGISDFLKDSIDISSCRKVLDFGGDKGQFIPDEFANADRYVYEISGTETVDGVHMITDRSSLGEFDWDLILCNQVMEHLSDVQSYFAGLVECMNANTYLYIEVPNERIHENIDIRIIHEHINMFSERSFRYLAAKNGIKLIKSVTEDANIRVLLHK